MPSHTTSFFFRLPNSRQLSFRRLGTSLCFSGALAAALGGCATLNSSPSASAEASSEPAAASHATAPVLRILRVSACLRVAALLRRRSLRDRRRPPPIRMWSLSVAGSRRAR